MKVLLAFLFLLFGCQHDFAIIESVETTGYLGYDKFETVDQAVDIMFLVDKSCSMNDDVDRLSATMPFVYDVLTGPEFTDLQWQAAAKSMDPSEVLTEWVSWDDPEALLKLMTLMTRTSTAQDETGLAAAVGSVAWEDNFYRDDADLLYVFLSDEIDQSNMNTEYYVDVMDSVKEEPFLVTESAIVVTESSTCQSSGATVGYGYIEVSEILIDLCDTNNWIDSLNTVRDHLPYVNTRFTLSQVPVAPAIENIKVVINYVEDEEIVSIEYFDWTYDPDTNVLLLDKAPLVGATVEVFYVLEE